MDVILVTVYQTSHVTGHQTTRILLLLLPSFTSRRGAGRGRFVVAAVTRRVLSHS